MRDGEGSQRRHRFFVDIRGIELTEEGEERINAAIQQAVLREVARLDFGGDVAARIGDGTTQGIRLIALSRDQAEEIGLAAQWEAK